MPGCSNSLALCMGGDLGEVRAQPIQKDTVNSSRAIWLGWRTLVQKQRREGKAAEVVRKSEALGLQKVCGVPPGLD